MTRADRLLALVAELRSARGSGPVPVQELARRLAVSARTVRRDLATLAGGGLPVRFDRGRGYSLAVAEPPVRRLNEASSLVGPLHDTLTSAVRTRRVVRLAYTDQAGERTSRDVEAHGLVIAPYGEYLVGWCRMRDGPRMFRLDRIGAAYLTAREAGLRDLDDLLGVLRVPGPRPPADDGPGAGRARGWALDRIRHVLDRLAQDVADTVGNRAGTAALRGVLGHLAEWTRWQVAAVRAGADGGEPVFDGRRPPFPPEFDRSLPYEVQERMIQDAMAMRSLAEMARDLGEVLEAAAHWAADCDDALWSGTLPDPADPARLRPLADLLAGWWSPVSHIEWHLDRLADGPAPEPVTDENGDEIWIVDRCPLQL